MYSKASSVGLFRGILLPNNGSIISQLLFISEQSKARLIDHKDQQVLKEKKRSMGCGSEIRRGYVAHFGGCCGGKTSIAIVGFLEKGGDDGVLISPWRGIHCSHVEMLFDTL
ncbi:hypothetical protein QVD17_38031 [Tagetes erecta]|uniref:Uncharacterized protein n=1 Tax=Tagetes erecta TaxID=13708 RepID=A0AAD8NJR5_TARER|nr:hypothetical protein QVD17_38031 [Tagetes erecta]